MAIRIQQYNTQPRNIHAGGIDPGFAQPLIKDAGRSAESDLIHEMARAGMQITEVGIREYVKDQSTAVAAALNDYRRQLNEEKERFTQENKGKDAVNAGEHFDTFARETAKPLADQFSGRAREMFLRDAAATGLHFTEQGQAYGRREKEAWQKSVFEGDMSETLNAIAGDPGNAEFVQQSLAELKQRMVDMTPGLDHRAMEADLNRKVAGVTIDALLARDNVGGAREAFGQYRELLGAAAPQFEARIRAKGRELESRARTRQVNDFLTATAEMDPVERLQLAEKQFGKDPAQRAQYDAACSGIMHMAKMKEQVEDFTARQQLKQMAGEMEEIAKLPPAESFARFQEMQERVPLEKREAFWKIANNLRNPGRYDEQSAIDDVTRRQLEGEEFDIRAEYGSRLTPATVQKLESKAYREALPSIRTAFMDTANEWLGDDKNKKHAKELGVGTKSELWTRFVNQTDADEKKDYVRLRREAEEFFKKVTLEKPGFFYNSNVNTVQGLVPGVLEKAPDARPKQGTPEYGAAVSALQTANIPPDGMWGGYTDEQLALGYQLIREQRKGGAQQ